MSYQAPRGTQDIYGDEAWAWKQLQELFENFCYVYRFEPMSTPTFEMTNVFKRDNDSSDMVNKEMYTFSPANSKDSITLRPEGTAGVIRAYVEHKLFSSPDLPARFYYFGPMHRHERPQKGRLRIFNQFGVESLGVKDPYADVEAMMLAYSILKAAGLEDLRILVNTLGDDESRAAYRKALREYFSQYEDDMCSDCRRRLEQNPLRILDCKVDHDKEWMKNAPDFKDYLNEESKEYFDTVLRMLDEMDIPYTVDSRLVRGLDYYTHTVFEIVSENKEMGAQSTLLAGGRYDNLIPGFGGPEQSGIGWALGMERLLIALQAEGIELQKTPELDVLVMPLGKEAKDYAFKLLCELRANGYRSDMDFANKSMKAQFKMADRGKAKVLVIVGENEAAAKTANIKIAGSKEQTTVPETELVSVIDAIFEKDDGHHHHD